MEGFSEQQIKEIEIRLSKQKKKIRDEERAVLESKILLRINTLESLYNSFMNKYSNIKDVVHINKYLLYAIVKSYYYDIHRFKDFSCSTWADNHKQAAYTVKWISKFRPIQIIIDEKEIENRKIEKDLFLINSFFALFAGFSFLGNANIISSISTRFYTHLIYLTLYRNISGKQLSSLFYLIEKCYVNKITNI
jgi:hypothetical protein